VLDLKLADLAHDQQLLQTARQSVIDIYEEDPDLLKTENTLLRTYFEMRNPGISWDKIS